jgi:zinc and cadmium transporter
LAASSFLYIAVADLIPGLHRRVDPGSGVKQFALIVAGVVLIYVTHDGMH